MKLFLSVSHISPLKDLLLNYNLRLKYNTFGHKIQTCHLQDMIRQCEYELLIIIKLKENQEFRDILNFLASAVYLCAGSALWHSTCS